MKIFCRNGGTAKRTAGLALVTAVGPWLAPLQAQPLAPRPSFSNLLQQAVAALGQNRGEVAMQRVNDAIALETNNAQGYYLRGLLFVKLRNPEQALTNFDSALRLNPVAAEALEARGTELMKLGRMNAALQDFDRLAALRPEKAGRLWQQGVAFYFTGKFDDARQVFEARQQEKPDVHNVLWHFQCNARASGLTNALRLFLPMESPTNTPLAELLAFYRGQVPAERVIAAARGGPLGTGVMRRTECFLAHFYLGLFFEAVGSNDLARLHLGKAAGAYQTHDAFGDLAGIFFRRLEEPALARATPDKPEEGFFLEHRFLRFALSPRFVLGFLGGLAILGLLIVIRLEVRADVERLGGWGWQRHRQTLKSRECVPPPPPLSYTGALGLSQEGKHAEAIQAIETELAHRPTDYAGQFLKARIQAEQLNDLEAACRTIRTLCSQQGHSQKAVIFALNKLADWQLHLGRNRAGAVLALQEIMVRYPEMEPAVEAELRLTDLAGEDIARQTRQDRELRFWREAFKERGVRAENDNDPDFETLQKGLANPTLVANVSGKSDAETAPPGPAADPGSVTGPRAAAAAPSTRDLAPV